MGQTEGMQLVSSRTEGHMSSQDVESRGVLKRRLCQSKNYLLLHQIKKRCFACHDTSHNLEQCTIKYKQVPVAHQCGYATKYPFTIIQRRRLRTRNSTVIVF
jgi:translation initiation factor 4A